MENLKYLLLILEIRYHVCRIQSPSGMSHFLRPQTQQANLRSLLFSSSVADSCSADKPFFLFAASLELSGASASQQVPGAHKKEKHTTVLPHELVTVGATHTLSGRHKPCPLIPALLFCSSRFNWGFEPASFLSGCDEPKIAL